jgi:hypothetical protein
MHAVRHIHAAIVEVGIVYATLMVHEGWSTPGPRYKTVKTKAKNRPNTIRLPIIERIGSATNGHAIALVGYTAEGLIVQNSWGKKWGAGGFALLPYEDFLMHATDVWVAQLGVPVRAELWDEGEGKSTSGLYRAKQAIPLNSIRPYVIDIGSDGKLSQSGDYWTSPQDVERLFLETIPTETTSWKKRRILLYLHGGLNSENDAAKRIVAFRDVLKKNEIYPVHIMWETDWFSTLCSILKDAEVGAQGRSFGERLTEAADWIWEMTAAVPGTRLWQEMKRNAESASNPSSSALRVVVESLKLLHQQAHKSSDDSRWELHVVGHSAGAIFAAHAASLLAQLKDLHIDWKTLQLLAPAIKVSDFRELLLPLIQEKACPVPSIFLLPDELERGDTVGPYAKSLLYLVSNAFEDKRATPILGMQRFLGHKHCQDIVELLSQRTDKLPGIVHSGDKGEAGAISSSTTHGGFDNDPDTMNSVLYRILGTAPKTSFTAKDLNF